METHDLMGGKLHVYKRENSRYGNAQLIWPVRIGA
jgi:hypothetical protein